LLFSNLEISRETDLEKSRITMKFLPLTTSGGGSKFDPPFEEAHQPDGRPAGRQRRATEKRTSAQVVLSTSPRPDSVNAGRTTDKGDSRGRTRSLEIDARRCKPQQATKTGTSFGSGRSTDRKGFELRFILRKEGRSERVWTSVHSQEGRKIGKGLDFGSFSGRKEDRNGFGLRFILRKEGRSERVWTSVHSQEGRKIGKGLDFGPGSGRSENRKGLRLRKIGKPERASAQEDRNTGKGFGSGRLENRKGLRLRKIGKPERASAQEDRKVGRSFGY
jgi:hypothetical protein